MSAWEIVQKPFPSEHAARQTDPGKYDSFRRVHIKGFPVGVDVIYGIKDRKTEIQTIRFDKTKWTVDMAREWLKAHNFKTNIEAAVKKTENIWVGLF